MHNESRPGPFDYNRADRSRRPAQDDGTCPRSLRWAYWLLLAASVVMLTTALVGFFGTGEPTTAHVNPALGEFLSTNRTIISVVNGVGAVIFSLFGAQLPRGFRPARWVCTATAALTIFANVGALALGLGGLVLLIAPALLAAALVLMFRPSATLYL